MEAKKHDGCYTRDRRVSQFPRIATIPYDGPQGLNRDALVKLAGQPTYRGKRSGIGGETWMLECPDGPVFIYRIKPSTWIISAENENAAKPAIAALHLEGFPAEMVSGGQLGDLEVLKNAPIYGNHWSDRKLFDLADKIIKDESLPMEDRLAALSKLDVTVGGSGEVEEKHIKEYIECD